MTMFYSNKHKKKTLIKIEISISEEPKLNSKFVIPSSKKHITNQKDLTFSVAKVLRETKLGV